MQVLNIYTLGTLSIQQDDQPVRGFVSRKVEALLVYLAMERREHPREILADLLWGDQPQQRAAANLRMALSNLQSLLPHYLLVTRQTVRINPESPCWIDAFELAQALKAASGDLTGPVTRQLQAALELYKGDFLAGFQLRDSRNFEGWMILEAERLRGRSIEALQRLSRDSLDRRDYTTGIEQAQRALVLDPLTEETHRTLMLLFARSGQRTAALAQYETCVRLLREELDIAPEPETTRIYAQIQSEQITTARATEKQPFRLPIPATPFIERPVELGQITERLDNPDCRLLTIVGPGGIGKTRLALQAAAERANTYRDGVYFVSLVSVQSSSFLPIEIANVLHFTIQGIVHPREELIGYLANRELLLVLDNFEHLVDGTDLLSDILSRAPDVRILVTSREWLSVQQEWVLPIGGMDYPETGSTVSAEAVHYNAVQLFGSCALRVRPRFSLDDELESVVRICQLVEGMPLSIELAAAWLRVIPASEIAQQINLKFLSSQARDLPERHRRVDTIFDYSWKMLSEQEARVLMKLSVFKGPFDRAAAIQVAGATILALAALIEKSLIRLVDENYYDIHELLRQYAFNQLTEAGEAVATQDAHLAYYVNLTSDPDSKLHGKQQIEWLDRLKREHDNLRTALGWALAHTDNAQREAGLMLAASIWEFWLMRGHINEGRQWLDRMLAAANGGDSPARGEAAHGAGYLAWIQGEHDRAETLHLEALAIRRSVEDNAGIGGSLTNLGLIAWSRGDFSAAHEHYEQAMALCREANHAYGFATVLMNLALLLHDQSEYAQATTHAEEAWAIFKELDDLQGMASILFHVGTMTYDRGDWERARTIEDEALDLARQLGDERVIGALLQNLGQVLISLGDYPLAHNALNESLQLVTQAGDRSHTALVKQNMARLALYENRMADAQTLIVESLTIFRKLQSKILLGEALLTHGDIQWMFADCRTAESTYREALSILLGLKNAQAIAGALYRLAGTAYELGDPARAVILLSRADTIAQQIDLRFPDKPERLNRDALRTSLSPADFDEAAQMGMGMEIVALVSYLGLDIKFDSTSWLEVASDVR